MKEIQWEPYHDYIVRKWVEREKLMNAGLSIFVTELMRSLPVKYEDLPHSPPETKSSFSPMDYPLE